MTNRFSCTETNKWARRVDVCSTCRVKINESWCDWTARLRPCSMFIFNYFHTAVMKRTLDHYGLTPTVVSPDDVVHCRLGAAFPVPRRLPFIHWWHSDHALKWPGRTSGVSAAAASPPPRPDHNFVLVQADSENSSWLQPCCTSKRQSVPF